MACFLPRNLNDQNSFPDNGRANNLRSFGRELQNFPDSKLNQQRSQSIKNASSNQQATKVSMDLDANINEQDYGVRRSSPRKFSMHVKHSSGIPTHASKRLSSQIETSSSHATTNAPLPPPPAAFSIQQLKIDMRTVENELNAMARQDSHTPTLVAQYSKQIFDYLRVREGSFKVNGYIEKQTHISERMRAILVDWIVEAHKKFKLLPETLFMAVNIIDRYLDVATISREKLQLVGVTALFVCAKYEEIYPPQLKDFIELTQKAFTKSDILAMEGSIVNSLKFNLTVPSSLRFLERYSRVEKLDKRSFDLSQYLLELSLVEYKFVKFPESMKACAAIYLTNKLFKRAVCWTDVTAAHAQYTEAQIRQCALDMCMTLQNVPTASTQAVRKKFLTPAFSEVATIQIEKISTPALLANNTNGNSSSSAAQPSVNVIATIHPTSNQNYAQKYPY